MAEHHQRAADNDRAYEAEQSIGDQPARHWHQIHAGLIQAVDTPGAGDVEVQRLVHVQDEDRHHRVEAVALPQFGEEEDVQPRRVGRQTRAASTNVAHGERAYTVSTTV